LDVSKFRPWTFRIARDQIFREYRRRRRPVHTVDEAQLAEAAVHAELDSGIDREAVLRCLELLSPEHREALVLRYFEELSYEEIAAITGNSVGTVRSRIHYGKAALKQAWNGNSYESPN
jgi:RNA polymerase sigma-70 factor, ECF subfamily